MSRTPNVDDGRRHIERFRAPKAVRAELTEMIQQAGSLVWGRPDLEPAKRSLTTIGVLVALGHLGPLREHLEIGMANGLSQAELCEAIMHCGIYAGLPATLRAMEVAAEFFDGDGGTA